MKKILTGTLLLLTLVSGCQLNTAVAPEPIIVCPPSGFIGRDSVFTGNYLGIDIQSDAETVYAAVQTLQQTKGVAQLNVVSNFSSDVTQLRERLPLYQYILLDQRKGTDSGVQLTLEGDQVKAIYLNSGQKLSQWPANAKAASSSVRIGDTAGSLYDKLVRIRQESAYATTFERILLLTKTISKPYDPLMRQSPQWYFAYTTEPNRMDEVQIHFKDGKVSHFYINHYMTTN
ncbi:hypothetical protein [Larkinella knui]|uniref:Lipoprotein n=1 Tax=Larkinella knui TaxID=2025310 RepID=A0A3P1CQ19_9BACT|nr:hypothetical protein [Larkinella knui]RRB15422.1 hypothetical protein EHT87_12910 [Larkinella knui]